MSQADRRQALRHEVAIAAEIELRGETCACTTRDISEGGVSIAGPGVLEEGATLQLTLLLTQDGIEDPDEQPFTATTKVMWSAPSDDGGGIAGLRFEPLSDAQRAHLGRFVRTLQGGAGPG